jgi:hypothetical protein
VRVFTPLQVVPPVGRDVYFFRENIHRSIGSGTLPLGSPMTTSYPARRGGALDSARRGQTPPLTDCNAVTYVRNTAPLGRPNAPFFRKNAPFFRKNVSLLRKNGGVLRTRDGGGGGRHGLAARGANPAPRRVHGKAE